MDLWWNIASIKPTKGKAIPTEASLQPCRPVSPDQKHSLL